MPERENRRITEHEIREAELQMTGRPPASATGFIGFVPAAPNAGTDGNQRPASSNGAGADANADEE
jgi:hypothetical protein